MSLSNGRGFSNTPLIYLNPRSKDIEGEPIEKPYFEISRVNPETKKIEKTGETCSQVDGDIVLVDFGEHPVKNVIQHQVIFFIKDQAKNETYYINLNYRMSTRSLFNGILSLTDPKSIAISYYRSKKGYEAFGLTQGEGEKQERVSWKYQLEELPETEPIKDSQGNVIKNDTFKLDSFFLTALKEWATKLGIARKKNGGSVTGTENAAQSEGAPSEKKTAPATKAAAEPELQTAGKKDEDLPF